MAPFTLNCSRIGVTGGLRSFAEQVMAVVADVADPVEAVLPAKIAAPAGIRKIETPQSLGSTSSASLLRPLAWLAYSRFQFPVPRERKILCTTHHVLPSHKRQIVTVHDLRPYFYPDTPLQRYYFHHMLPKALRRCDGVLTVSNASRDLLMEVYGLPESSIRVVPNVIDIPEIGLPKSSTGAKPVGGERYLLMVGASMPHKNADEVFRMHRLWEAKYRLKIIAGSGSYRSHLEALAGELGISDRVDFLSRVDGAQLQELYANCAAVVYPSKMEGFGLPPLEAMAHGRPAIVSDIPTFREVYGDFASFVTLGDEASWADALSRIDDFTEQRAVECIGHVKSFGRERLGESLESALRYFWGEQAS